MPKPFTPDELHAWRTARGLTLKDTASILGVHWITVWRWEKGRISPPAALRYTIRALNTPVGRLRKTTD